MARGPLTRASRQPAVQQAERFSGTSASVPGSSTTASRLPSMVMIDAQTARGGRYGPTFHEAGVAGVAGRSGPKRTLPVEILGLPVAAHAGSARPHDVAAAREVLGEHLSDLPDLRGIVGDRAYRRFARLADRKHVQLEVKAPPKGMSGLTPLLPLYKIEHAIAQLGRWRRLSRCYEGSEASARAWLEAACVGYLAWRGPGSSSANRLAYPSSISRSTAPAANSATGPEPRNPIRTTRATTSGDERS